MVRSFAWLNWLQLPDNRQNPFPVLSTHAEFLCPRPYPLDCQCGACNHCHITVPMILCLLSYLFFLSRMHGSWCGPSRRPYRWPAGFLSFISEVSTPFCFSMQLDGPYPNTASPAARGFPFPLSFVVTCCRGDCSPEVQHSPRLFPPRPRG